MVILSVVGPLLFFGYLVFQDADNFARTYDPSHLNETIQPILSRLGIPGGEQGPENASRPGEIANWLGIKIRDTADAVVKELIGQLPLLALGFFVTGFVTYYGFLDGEHFYWQLRHTIPLPDRIEDALFHQIRDVTRAVFIGTLLVAALSAALGTATFLAFGVPNALFWAFIMIILGVLPIVGAPFVWIPASAWLLLEDRPIAAATVFLANAVGGFVYIEHVLRPRLIGKMGRVHPVWVLVGVFGGLEVFGILGFIIGPLVLAIFVALVRSYTEWHPRWVHRIESGLEPYHPGGRLKPQPFSRAPETEKSGRSATGRSPRKRRRS